jgi:HAD superfamily hydrolase (TIGR01509 family)
MKYKAIIFDFNGTLLLDSPWHEEAWLKMAEEFTGEPLSLEDYQNHVHGRTNKAILTYLLGREPNVRELDEMSEQKEAFYRKICLQKGNAFSLAPGVECFLNAVKENNIPCTIATGSYWGNVKFFIEHLHLEKWFDTSLFVYDNNSFPGKPAPDVFIKAAAKLNVLPKDCVVIEDSLAGVKAAHAADIGKVVTIEPSLSVVGIEDAGGASVIAKGFEELDLDNVLG